MTLSEEQEVEMKRLVKQSSDPWKHRSTMMSCQTCMWFVLKVNISEKNIGRCRRRAPTMSGYPVVFTNDWCGDHKLDENMGQ